MSHAGFLLINIGSKCCVLSELVNQNFSYSAIDKDSEMGHAVHQI